MAKIRLQRGSDVASISIAGQCVDSLASSGVRRRIADGWEIVSCSETEGAKEASTLQLVSIRRGLEQGVYDPAVAAAIRAVPTASELYSQRVERIVSPTALNPTGGVSADVVARSGGGTNGSGSPLPALASSSDPCVLCKFAPKPVIFAAALAVLVLLARR